MTRSLAFSLLTLAAAVLLGANPCTAQSYTLTELPIQSPTAINNNGQIGGADPATSDPSGNDPFILNSNGTLMDLGNLGATCQVYGCRAAGLNSLGDAVGLAGNDPGSYKPFVFSNGQIARLEPDSANPLSINGSGTIAGYFYPTLCDPLSITHGFVIKNGVFTDLSQPTDPSLPCNVSSEAHGINTSGQIAGSASNNGAAFEASVWQPDGAITFLGFLPGENYSRAFAINDAGQVTGNAYTTVPQYSLHAFLFSNGKMTDIDTLNSQASWAFGINSNGVVVGQVADQPDSMAYHAFVYMGGSMMDLNALIPAASGLTLYQANAVNDAGEIVAFASSNTDGSVHGVLLTPVAPQITSISPTSGVAGTLVTINGNHFTSKPKACLVTINGKVAKWTTWSNTKIQVQVPSGLTLGTGHVVVTAFFQHSRPVTFTVK